MNNTIKTSIAASLALLISFAMLFAYLNLDTTGNQVDTTYEKFSSAVADSGEKRIFLIGSSYVERLNSTYIKQYLSENGLQQFQVYNIAKNGAGNPSQQSQFLGSMIASHPTVVVYGLGFRELGYLPYTNTSPKCASVGGIFSVSNNKTSFSTPSIQDAATYLGKIIPVQTDYFSNIADPKHVTVDFLKSHFEENASDVQINNSTSGVLNENFIEKRDPQFINIRNLDEINKPLDYTVRVCPEDMNNELTQLSKMVSVFKKNNIKVILFVPPFSQSYLNAVGDEDVHGFLTAMEKFSNENELPLYDLHNKYVNLNIWADVQHVAQNPQVVVYSDDVAKIIFKELQSFTNMKTVDTSAENLSYKDLSYADLRSVNLSGKNMTGTILMYSNLYGANMTDTILTDANLGHAYMHNLDLSGEDLTGTILTGADLTNADLADVELAGKDLTGTNLSGVNLSGKDLTGTILVGTNLVNTNLTDVDLSHKNLTGANLAGDNLSGQDFTGTILAGANLDYANLHDVDLAGKNLTGTSLKGVYLADKDLTGALLIGSNLAYANLSDIDLTGKNLTGAFLFRTNLQNADLANADLSGDNLRKTILIGTNLNNAKLRNADLSGNNLSGTEFVGADLHGAIMPSVNLANKDLTGTILVDTNLVNANFTGVDLSGKDFTGSNLRGTHFDYAILSGVNLGMKNLTGTTLEGSDLTKAVLWKAKLVDANLVGADLSHSDLRNALIKDSNLTNANLSGANLSGANLSGDDLQGTILVGANLASANLTGVDMSKTITDPSKIKSTSASHALPRTEVISNFQSTTGWIKQSSSGNQSYDHTDFINGSQSLKLVTAGNGSPIVTHSNIFSHAFDLSHYVTSAWIKVDNSSKVKEFWIYLSSDGLKSSWFTYKISIPNHVKSGEWTKISIDPKQFAVTGTPDISAINRIQIRINDDSTGPVTLHINEILAQKETSK
ncbi:MAG TPA: pentapeptide repeat-containing protein [Candidatus Nitrosotalea sp.]|nr:pentapeptide repeat-containing protein [Candidatus Nitrosotalea sp.]